jgi:hypothetical protein
MSFRNEKVFNAVSEDEAMLIGQGSSGYVHRESRELTLIVTCLGVAHSFWTENYLLL